MKYILLLSVVMTTACAGSLNVREHASLSGNPEGIRAMFDGLNGLITNGKQTPDTISAHWQIRDRQESELTKRSGILDDLLNREVEQK